MPDSPASFPANTAIFCFLNSKILPLINEFIRSVRMWPFQPNIAKMESRSDVNGVIKSAAHKDKSIALAALAALGRLSDKAGLGALQTALKSNDGDKIKTAAESLVSIGRSAVDVVAAALKDENNMVRSNVARALIEAISMGNWDDLAKRRVGDLAAAGEWQTLSRLALDTTDQNVRAFIQDMMRGCSDPWAIKAFVNEALSSKGKRDTAIELLTVCDKPTTGNIIAKSIFDSTEPLKARLQPAKDLLVRIIGPEKSVGLIKSANIDHIVNTIAELYGKMASSLEQALFINGMNWKGKKDLENMRDRMVQICQYESFIQWQNIAAFARPMILSDEIWQRDAAIEGIVKGLRKAISEMMRKDNIFLALRTMNESVMDKQKREKEDMEQKDFYFDAFLSLTLKNVPELYYNLNSFQLRMKANP